MSAKPVVFLGSTRKEIGAFPEDVRDEVGFALWQAQQGGKHPSVKPLRGFGGAGVLEVVVDHDGDTFRAVYTVKLAGTIYVLHAFKKRSKQGAALPREDRELIVKRLRQTETLHERGERR